MHLILESTTQLVTLAHLRISTFFCILQRQNIPVMKRLLLLFAVMGALLAACRPAAPFSGAEQTLIRQGDAQTPFRVLQITHPQDSLILRTPCEDIKNFSGDTTLALLVAPENYYGCGRRHRDCCTASGGVEKYFPVHTA